MGMDGNIMGTMPGQFYITPLNLYKATKMIDFGFIRQALALVKKGKKEYQAQLAQGASKGIDRLPPDIILMALRCEVY